MWLGVWVYFYVLPGAWIKVTRSTEDQTEKKKWEANLSTLPDP